MLFLENRKLKDNVDKGLFPIAMANKEVKLLGDLYLKETKRTSSLVSNITVAIKLSYSQLSLSTTAMKSL